jgi:Tfp pilus assembly protein FimV
MPLALRFGLQRGLLGLLSMVLLTLTLAARAESGQHAAQVNADGVLVMIDPMVHAGQALSAARVLQPVHFSETPIELNPFPELWLLALPELRPESPSWLRIELTTAAAERIEVDVWVDPQATVLGPVRSGQTLWRLGRQAAELDPSTTGRSAGEWVTALHALNPAAFEDGAMDRLRQGALLHTESPSAEAPLWSPAVETVIEVSAALPAEEGAAEQSIEQALLANRHVTAEPVSLTSQSTSQLTRQSTAQHYSPINPVTGVAGTVVVVVIALLALWNTVKRRAPVDPSARLAAQFAQRGRPELARGWWAEALLKADSEPQRQRLRQSLQGQPAQQEAGLDR